MESSEANPMNIQKVRSSFYNFASNNSSTMSASFANTEMLNYSCIARGGSRMKFVKTRAMVSLLKSMSTDRDCEKSPVRA